MSNSSRWTTPFATKHRVRDEHGGEPGCNIGGLNDGGFLTGSNAMQKALWPSSVIPPGFTIASPSIADAGGMIPVRSTSPTSQYPRCRSLPAAWSRQSQSALPRILQRFTPPSSPNGRTARRRGRSPHQAQADQASDVRPRKTRPPPGSTDRRHMIASH